MRRVLVIGSPGAGKTTLSTQLAGKLNVPVHYLDDLPNNLAGAAGSKWIKGAHIIYRTNPPSGGWTRAVCTGGGTVGGSPVSQPTPMTVTVRTFCG